VDLPVLEVLADSMYRSQIADPLGSRKMHRKGAAPGGIPGIAVRVIEHTLESEDGGQPSETFTLVSDIPDPSILAMEQAAAAYAC
jgi:hypothetical protein